MHRFKHILVCLSQKLIDKKYNNNSELNAVNIKITSFLKHFIFGTCLWLCGAGFLHAATITTVVDDIDPNNDQTLDLNLSRLMPIAQGNTWTYDLMKGTNPAAQSIEAEVGFREKIGGGCLALNPIIFGADITLYVGNYEEYLSLHGIHINRWKGLDDVVLKFETRDRVFWKDFQNRYISGPAQANSCQDTEWGRVERKGLVMLEDLTENLGEVGNQRGEIDCRAKNSDLRSARVSSPVQTGSGTANLSGSAQTLYWSLDSIIITPDALDSGDVGIEMVFNPNIGSSGNDYRMFINMVLRPRVGIVSLQVNDDAAYVMDEIHDLSYTLTDSDLASNENQIVPKGTCPEDSGSIPLFIICLLMGYFPIRIMGYRLKNV